jgi:hypothetical protein
MGKRCIIYDEKAIIKFFIARFREKQDYILARFMENYSVLGATEKDINYMFNQAKKQFDRKRKLMEL